MRRNTALIGCFLHRPELTSLASEMKLFNDKDVHSRKQNGSRSLKNNI
jgi:hypothetical protein